MKNRNLITELSNLTREQLYRLCFQHWTSPDAANNRSVTVEFAHDQETNKTTIQFVLDHNTAAVTKDEFAIVP